MTDLSQSLIDIARSGHHAALAYNRSRWPQALIRHEAEITGDPAPVYAPAPRGDLPSRDDRPGDDQDAHDQDAPAPLQCGPFHVGQRIIDRRQPFWAMTVLRCTEYPLGGWRVDWKIDQAPGLSPLIGSQSDVGLIAVPENWQDCPAMPRSARDWLELSTDGPLSRAAVQAADDEDAGNARNMRWLRYYHDRRAWAARHLLPVARDLALAEIANMNLAIAAATPQADAFLQAAE